MATTKLTSENKKSENTNQVSGKIASPNKMDVSLDQSTPVTRRYRVGIPRGLYFYKFFPIWETILTKMNCEIVISPETNKAILERGAKFSSSELCVPMKIYFGHVLTLLEKEPNLDFLFVPRYVSLVKTHYFCPKFMSLPDAVRNTIKPKIPVLEWEINAKVKTHIESAIDLGKQLKVGQKESAEAYVMALNKFKEFKNYQHQGMLFPDIMSIMYPQYVSKNRKKMVKKDGDAEIDAQYPITLLVLGHPYNTFEGIINLNLIERLEKYHVKVVMLENMPEDVFKKMVTINDEFHNHWNMEEEMLQVARYYLIEGIDEIDGVLFLISFACGPDSLIQELIMRDFKKVKKPFLDLILDEHSGEGGMVTRVESFIDMIRRKKYFDKK